MKDNFDLKEYLKNNQLNEGSSYEFFDEDGNPNEEIFKTALQDLFPDQDEEIENYMTNNDEGFANLLSQVSFDDSPEEILKTLTQNFNEYIGTENLKEEYGDEDEEYEEDEDESWASNDGWNGDFMEDMGLMDWFADVEKIAYEIRNTMRGSYGIDGDTLEDLIEALNVTNIQLGEVIENMGRAGVAPENIKGRLPFN